MNIQIKQVVNDFSKAWEAGSQPELLDAVQSIPSDLVEEALELLIPIDVNHRHQQGQSVDPSQYESLGSSAVELADKKLQQLSGSSAEVDLGEELQTGLYPDTAPRGAAESGDAIPDFGNYKLLEQIGEGGMGKVYLAEQLEPIQRKVAIKIVRGQLDNRDIIARFDSERRALAMMEHPNISRILDAGTSPVGQPFFVMELVDGVPLNEYCDQNQLKIKQRLELFATVCDAVQHAHQKGIIHRDIKPNNVLLTIVDGKPLVKVIDFGLAKAINPQIKLNNETVLTKVQQFVGTILYASPEQVVASGDDLDTRSDVYSLGAMLYELLVGSTPLSRQELKTKAWLDIVESIRDVDPPRPSARLLSAPDASQVGQDRGSTPAAIARSLKGELDWIIMRAIEKDPARRYPSANEFSNDIHRFLNDDVVVARQPTMAYRLQKFTKKNRVLVVSAVTIALILISSLIGITWLALDRGLARDQAVTERNKADDLRMQADVDLIQTNQDRARWSEVVRLSNRFEEDWSGENPDVLLAQITAQNGMEKAADAARTLDRVEAIENLNSTHQAQVLLWKGDLLQLDPEHGDEAMALIREAMELGLDEESEKYARAILKIYDENDVRESTRLLQEIKADNPFNERATVLLLSNLFLTGRYEEARDEIKLARQIFGQDEPRLLILEAWMLLAEGNREQAAPILSTITQMLGEEDREIVQIAGESFAVLNGMLLGQTDSSAAIKLIMSAIRSGVLKSLAEKSPSGKFSISDNTTRHPIFRAFLSLSQDLVNPMILVQIGFGNFGRLRRAFEEAHEIYPDGMYSFLIAQTFMADEKYQEAINYFERCLTEDSISITCRDQAIFAIPMCRFLVGIQKGKDKELIDQAFESLDQMYSETVEVPKLEQFQLSQLLQICVKDKRMDLGRRIIKANWNQYDDNSMLMLYSAELEVKAGNPNKAYGICQDYIASHSVEESETQDPMMTRFMNLKEAALSEIRKKFEVESEVDTNDLPEE